MPELRSRVPSAIQAAVASVCRPLHLCVANFSCFPAIAMSVPFLKLGMFFNSSS